MSIKLECVICRCTSELEDWNEISNTNIPIDIDIDYWENYKSDRDSIQSLFCPECGMRNLIIDIEVY